MAYIAKDYSFLKGKVEGLSDKQLEAHFGLYSGYVKKWNEIQDKLAKQDKSQANYSFGEFSELKRREAVAFNGVFLHELYFENLLNGGLPSKELKKKAAESFGSWENFIADVKACAMSTPGWVLVTWNRKIEKLHTFILFEHHIGLPAHQEILLCLDCWEHAYMIDYATEKAKYLETFLNNINWDAVNKRFDELKVKK